MPDLGRGTRGVTIRILRSPAGGILPQLFEGVRIDGHVDTDAFVSRRARAIDDRVDRPAPRRAVSVVQGEPCAPLVVQGSQKRSLEIQRPPGPLLTFDKHGDRQCVGHRTLRSGFFQCRRDYIEVGLKSPERPSPSTAVFFFDIIERMNKDIRAYNAAMPKEDKKIATVLMKEIDLKLKGAESKIWHRTAVWFLDGNPIVGYSKRKEGVQLLFWSGQSFDEEGLKPEGSFKAAEARYLSAEDIKIKDLHRWLKKAQTIQWDYKNIVKRKGKLLRVK